MNPTLQQIALWDSWRKRWDKKIRPLTKQTLAICEYSAKLQVFLDDLNFPVNIWDDSKTEDIKYILDVFNRVESSVSKVDLQIYGLRFDNDDIDIMAPPNMTSEQILDDEFILQETFGFVFIVIGIGLIVLGGVLKVSEHVARRETFRINEQKLGYAKIMKDTGASSPEIKAAVDDFNVENKDLIGEAGLLDTIFGGGSGLMISAALGIGLLLFAFMQGRR